MTLLKILSYNVIGHNQDAKRHPLNPERIVSGDTPLTQPGRTLPGTVRR